MSAIIKENKRSTQFDLASSDIVPTCGAKVTDKIAGTTLSTKNGPNGEDRNLF